MGQQAVFVAGILGCSSDCAGHCSQSVPPGEACTSISQTRACNSDGTWGAWVPSYTTYYSSCYVQCAAGCTKDLLGNGIVNPSCLTAACCCDSGDLLGKCAGVAHSMWHTRTSAASCGTCAGSTLSLVTQGFLYSMAGDNSAALSQLQAACNFTVCLSLCCRHLLLHTCNHILPFCRP